jgi:hypothetical protein
MLKLSSALRWGRGDVLRTALTVLRIFSSPRYPQLGTFPFFLRPIFFGLTARVIPLRSGLRVFCFVGSALNDTGFPPTKQTLACDSAHPRSLSCPKQNGAERKGKNKMSYLNSVTLVGFVGSDPGATSSERQRFEVHRVLRRYAALLEERQ